MIRGDEASGQDSVQVVVRDLVGSYQSETDTYSHIYYTVTAN